jgi:hypothetical protein
LQLSPETADIINASNLDYNAGVNDETALLSALKNSEPDSVVMRGSALWFLLILMTIDWSTKHYHLPVSEKIISMIQPADWRKSLIWMARS